MIKDICIVCEGEFAHNEKIIELKGDRYCEKCYEDTHEDT